MSTTDVIACTGVSAFWCPIHGDCTCPRTEYGERERWDEDCPLHGEASNHPDGSWTPDVMDVLRAAQGEQR